MNQFITQNYTKIKKFRGIVFVDRDGTIIKDQGYLQRVEQVEFYPGVALSIRKLNQSNFAVVIVTNQPVIAAGTLSIIEVKHINDYLVGKLKEQDAFINAISFCPHHPNANINKYRQMCFCRKPGILMFEWFLKKYEMEKNKCFIIGDQTRDISAANKLKIQSFLVETGRAGMDGSYPMRPSYYSKDLNYAIDTILTKL